MSNKLWFAMGKNKNPYANVEDDHRNVDSDYFSQMSSTWAKQTPPTPEEIREFVSTENSMSDSDWNSIINEHAESISDQEVDATNPSHYNSVPEHLQHWDVVAQMGWDYHLGCATKYIWRAGKKKSAAMDDSAKEIQDLEKAVVYLNKKIDILKNK